MPELPVSDDKRKQFYSEFMSAYLSPSFGSLPKREVDILIFSLLYKYGAFSGASEVQKISRLLKISASRVRLLMRDMDLRSSSTGDDWFKNEVRRILASAMVGADHRSIVLGIERDVLRAEVEARIKQNGSTPEYGNNREILKIDFEAFAKFVDAVASDAEKERLRTAFRKAGGTVKLKATEAIGSAIVEALKKAIGEEASKVVGEKAVAPLIEWGAAQFPIF